MQRKVNMQRFFLIDVTKNQDQNPKIMIQNRAKLAVKAQQISHALEFLCCILI